MEEKEKPIDKEMSKEEQLVFSLKVSQAAKTSVFWRMWISRVKGLLVNQTITSQHHCCFSLQWCSCGAFSTTTTRAMPCCTYPMTSSLLLLPSSRMSWTVHVGSSLASCLTDLVSRLWFIMLFQKIVHESKQYLTLFSEHLCHSERLQCQPRLHFCEPHTLWRDWGWSKDVLPPCVICHVCCSTR